MPQLTGPAPVPPVDRPPDIAARPVAQAAAGATDGRPATPSTPAPARPAAVPPAVA